MGIKTSPIFQAFVIQRYYSRQQIQASEKATPAGDSGEKWAEMMRWISEMLRGKWRQHTYVTMTNRQFSCAAVLYDQMVLCVCQLPNYVRRTLKDLLSLPLPSTQHRAPLTWSFSIGTLPQSTSQGAHSPGFVHVALSPPSRSLKVSQSYTHSVRRRD